MTDTRPPAALKLLEVDEVEVTVEKLVTGGEGLARWEGIPLFVPRSAPGDRLRVRITDRRPDYGRGEIVEILEPGPGRRTPPCPYFVACGGCDLQHIEDRLQIRYKAAAVVETLGRLGGIRLPDDTEIVAGDMWAYRLRTQLHTESGEERTAVGYFARGSHTLVPVRSCPILVPALERVVGELGGETGRVLPRRIDLLAGADGAVSTAPVIEGLPHGEIHVQVGAYRYDLDARCFFQGHAGLVEALVARAVGDARGELAVDLYAGVGLFSLPLADRYTRVLAVEGDRVSARYAKRNVRRGRGGVEVVAQAVESWVARLPEEADRVLVDPPRAGLARPIREALLARPPARLTYVSCNPATLARDLRALAPRFAIERATLVDLFPQSGHMESVIQLVRRDLDPAADRDREKDA